MFKSPPPLFEQRDDGLSSKAGAKPFAHCWRGTFATFPWRALRFPALWPCIVRYRQLWCGILTSLDHADARAASALI
jgi:hypothetical protein